MHMLRARELTKQRPELRAELTQLFERIEQTPEANTFKGMYWTSLAGALNAARVDYVPPQRIQAFKDYPLRAYMELLLDSAITLYPNQRPSQGLRALGHLVVPTFANSIVGGVMMGTIGRSWEIALKCLSRGYEISLNPGKATVAEFKNTTALVQLRNIWNYGDSYQVGVIEGLMAWCGLIGRVSPHVIASCDVDLRIEWQVERGMRRGRPLPATTEAKGPS
jgi:uncharacterized protein (TIGR02265 family)